MDWEGLEQDLQRFEREEWGTNDWDEIQERIIDGEVNDRLKRMTGMPEEQADWEEGEEVI